MQGKLVVLYTKSLSEKKIQSIFTSVNVLALYFDSSRIILSLEECMQMNCFSVDTKKHLLHAFFSSFSDTAETEKRVGNLLSEV